MVFRKPYAFLIQYFQRIHLFLLGLCFYLFYKTTALRTFVSEFIRTESYNQDLESIKHYVGFLPVFVILLCLGILLTLMILLRHKKKPWKTYLFPFINYIYLLVVMLYIRNFFMGYNELSDITKIMAGRDLLFIAYIPQFAVFLLLILRTLGIDLNRFGFKNDKEYLEIKEEDREEVELNFNFDKDVFIRTFNKLLRNFKYFYHEHQFVLNAIFTIIIVYLVSYTYYYFAILHRIYKEGDTFQSNFYQITIKDSYLTNRKSNGDLIDKDDKYSYVIIKLAVKNLGASRAMYTDRFHLMNLNREGERASQYEDYFKEYGHTYDDTEFANNETKEFTMIYRVNSKWWKSRYMLYYQGLDKSYLLRKVRLKVKDYRKVETKDTKKLNQVMKIGNKDFEFTKYKILDKVTYNTYKCNSMGCNIMEDEATAYKKEILQIDYLSEYFEPKVFVDFSTKYAKIKYEDKKGKTSSIDCEDAIARDYTNNALYLKVPATLKKAKKIDLVYTINGEQYTYHIKE